MRENSSLAGRTVRPGTLQTERWIAMLRVAVVAVMGLVYGASLGVRRQVGPLALVILTLAAFYSLWVVLARPYERYRSVRFDAASLILDAGLLTLWCSATGGSHSEFWTTYLIVVVSAAMRYRPGEVMAAAAGLSVVYVSAMMVGGGLHMPSLLLRPALIVLAGFAGALISEQEIRSLTDKDRFQRLAAEHEATLGREQHVVSELRDMNQAKSDFVAVVSHELRSPLSGIMGVLDTLRIHADKLDAATQAVLLEDGSMQAHRLARLVEDLLTVSRIDDGVIRLALGRHQVERLVGEALLATGTASGANVHIDDVGQIECDPDCLVRVLVNLLDNAKKFSPEGSRIEVTVEWVAGSVRFSVRDHGPGVPAENRERVFGKYSRVGDTASVKGTGLGLYIVRNLVEAHGGEIVVSEAVGGGAEFAFTIPQREPADSTDDVEIHHHANVT